MNKVAHYLQEHLVGEVSVSEDACRYFSTDGSIFTVTPSMVVYPRNENDVRKVARFTWQLAERGRVVPITARGSGTDQAGAALGSGIILAFPAHMNRLLQLNNKNATVAVEPGANYAKVQQTLHTHGRFLPPFPSSIDFSTIGGAIANNAAGEKTIKYGSTRDYVRGLRVVLSNGEILETRRLSKRELNKKLGLSSFEGEIYRAVDTLIEENHDLIGGTRFNVTKNSAGYDLASVKHKDGSFDLSPLFVGSQGTLGIITEAVLGTEPYNPETTLIAAWCKDLRQAEKIVHGLLGLSFVPSAIEMVDKHLLQFVHQQNPNQLQDLVREPFPELILLIEFDNDKRTRERMAKKAAKILENEQAQYVIETDPDAQDKLWKIRHSAAAVIAHSEGKAKALPIIEDGIVPVNRFHDYVSGIYELFKTYKLQVAIWGHAGNANLHMQPFLDLSKVGDRQTIFKLIDDYYNMVIGLGGSTSGEHNDGRLRAPYLSKLYGEDMYALFQKVKGIFDPYGTLNPGVKLGVTVDDIKPLLRSEYSMEHLYDHMPRL